MQTDLPGNNQELDQAWRDVIIDHNQFPRCQNPVDQPSHTGAGENPLCGDRLTLNLKVNPEGIIEAVGIDVAGCAISTASASMMAAELKGKRLGQAQTLFKQVHEMLTSPPGSPGDVTGELEALKLICRYPLRIKCASLAWHVLNATLRGSMEKISTE